jgi:hypothetical protein
MLSRRTLAILAVLCLAVSLVARMLDQRLIDAHAVALAAASTVPDPASPAIKVALSGSTHANCTTACTMAYNVALLDTMSITTLVLGLGFALTALWKHLK